MCTSQFKLVALAVSFLFLSGVSAGAENLKIGTIMLRRF
jgi:hypothetical protein